MKKLFLRFVVLPLIALGSCSAATQKQSLNANAPAGSQKAETTDKQNAELRKQIEQIAAAAKGRVGVAVELLETKESISLNPQDRFPMQSVYKLPIGMAVLAQVDNKKLTLEQRVRVEKSDYVRLGQHSPIRDKNPNGVELSLSELLRLAVSESDGTASDVLLDLVGVEFVGKYLNGLGVTAIVVADSEKAIGKDWETQYRNWASPQGAVQLLRALHERRGLSEQSQQLLLKLMTETPTGPQSEPSARTGYKPGGWRRKRPPGPGPHDCDPPPISRRTPRDPATTARSPPMSYPPVTLRLVRRADLSGAASPSDPLGRDFRAGPGTALRLVRHRRDCGRVGSDAVARLVATTGS